MDQIRGGLPRLPSSSQKWSSFSGQVLFAFRHLGQADVVTSYVTDPWAPRGTLRRFISVGYTAVLSVMHGLDLRYYNGLTLYPTAFLRTRPITTFRFGFAAEPLLYAIYRGISYVEIGVPIQELAGGISKPDAG